MAQGSGKALSPGHTARERGHHLRVWVGASPFSTCAVPPHAAWLPCPWDGGSLGMSSGLSKWLSRIYHPEGWVRPSWESPAAPRVLMLSLAEEPGLPQPLVMGSRGCRTPRSCLPLGPCPSTWR